MTTTPDYAGLNLIAEAITEWFGERCPDYAEGCHSCEAWKEYDHLRALLESNAALKRERDKLKHDIERYVAISSEEATRAEAAEARVKELEAENARLKLALQAERQKPMRCAACNGDGQVSRSYGYIPCDACNGRGF